MSSKRLKTKTVYALRSPFPQPSWQDISSQLENTILDLLLPLLAPIGQHRQTHAPTSKGKNRKKRQKRNVPSHGDVSVEESPQASAVVDDSPRDILQYLTVGFNSTVRHLEVLSKQADPTQQQLQVDDGDVLPYFVAVFVCKSILPSIMTASLPLLAAMASVHLKDADVIRLVPISQSGASKLADALNQPNVNILGMLSDTPGAEHLTKLVRDEVGVVEVPWVRESMRPNYQPVKIALEEVPVPQPKPKDAKRKREKRRGSLVMYQEYVCNF